MKSVFGSKRKARKIQVDDDDEAGANDAGISTGPVKSPSTTSAISNPGKKAFKKSSLRQSIALNDLQQDTDDTGADDGISEARSSNTPTIGRSNSIKKKKAASSRLSFGPGEIISGDAAEALEANEAFTPKKATLGRRVIESNALRKTIPHQGLSIRDEDEERPTYSKDYLNELKSSTPTTPKDFAALQATAEDDGFDASELEGAMIVGIDEKFEVGASAAFIPSEPEIKEKKERRARLAHEQDFIALEDEGSGRQLSLLPRKKKAESRLVREDEDLGEGFDEFVDDGRISLGKKQEREARRRQRKEMADMIHQAEGSSDEVSDDSEAERRAAYEAAQTRAGMDGLHKPNNDAEAAHVQMPARITPLPGLSECLERLKTTMSTMEQDMALRHKKMADLEQEKREILAREVEVQELLKQAGARYSALKADTGGAMTDPQALVDASNGIVAGMVVDRGLESFGNTPTIRPDVEDVG